MWGGVSLPDAKGLGESPTDAKALGVSPTDAKRMSLTDAKALGTSVMMTSKLLPLASPVKCIKGWICFLILCSLDSNDFRNEEDVSSGPQIYSFFTSLQDTLSG